MRRESALGRRAMRAHHRLGTCPFPSSRDAHHDDDDDTWVPRSHRQWWTGVSPSNSCLRGTVWRLKKTNYIRKPEEKRRLWRGLEYARRPIFLKSLWVLPVRGHAADGVGGRVVDLGVPSRPTLRDPRPRRSAGLTPVPPPVVPHFSP